ncbi:MAG TPA: hypothetical protein VGF45_21955 [Polyangia bacterium]
MSFCDEDEISEETVMGREGRVGTIVEATLSHRRSVLDALGSAGLAVVAPRQREDLLQRPESDGHQRPRLSLW